MPAQSLLRRVLAGDRGEVTVELVIATPLLLFMLLSIAQFALWSHATHVAQAAAAQALAAARTQNGTPAAGYAAAQRLLDNLANGPLQHTTIHIARTGTDVQVVVRGEASPVLPGMRLPVHAEASGPSETFLPDLAPVEQTS